MSYGRLLDGALARIASQTACGALVHDLFSTTAGAVIEALALRSLALEYFGKNGQRFALHEDASGELRLLPQLPRTPRVAGRHRRYPISQKGVEIAALYAEFASADASDDGLALFAALLLPALLSHEDVYTISSVFEDAPLPMVAYDTRTETIVAVNSALCEAFGYRADDLTGADLSVIRPPLEQHTADAIVSRGTDRTRCRYRHRDGALVEVEVTARATIWNGAPARLACIANVEDRVDLERRLLASEKRLALVQGVGNVGIFEVDLQSGKRYWSKELCRQLELAPGHQVPKNTGPCLEYVHDDDREGVTSAIDRARQERTPFAIDFRTACGSRPRWLHVAGDFGYDAQGQAVRLSGTTLDITRRKAAEERLGYLARHDALTDLPNRTLLLDRLNHSVRVARRHDRRVAVISLDIDGFTEINDAFGHSCGDEVLREVGRRLLIATRETDCVARISADHFVVVLTEVASSNDAHAVAARIADSIATPMDVAGNKIALTTATGIAEFPCSDENGEALLANAETALSEAKGAGRNQIRIYSEEMRLSHFERVRVESELRRALELRELFCEYQPIVDMATRQRIGMEALVRWRHPAGLRSPAEFIPIAEQSELIVALGDYVLREACEEAVRWHESGERLLLSVNVSSRQLVDPGFVGRVRDIVQTAGLDPNLLELELTESALVSDLEATRATLLALRESGIRIAIDDFGTGYNSLANLRHCDVDTLKIDRSFVAQIGNSASDRAIVGAIVGAGHSLGARVVAEGVETEGHYSLLATLGCDHAQGYLFGRPQPANVIVRENEDSRVA